MNGDLGPLVYMSLWSHCYTTDAKIVQLLFCPTDDATFYESRYKRKQRFRVGLPADRNPNCYRHVLTARPPASAGAEAGPLPTRSQNALQLLQQTVQLRAVAALMTSPDGGSPANGESRQPQTGQPLLASPCAVEFRPSKRLQVGYVLFVT